MTRPTTARTSARLIADDHRALHALVAEIRGAFDSPSPHPAHGPDVVAARLDQLRGRLGAHFEEEERAGLFEQIVEAAPDQAHTCDVLFREHESLLARLDALRAAPPESRRDPAWEEAVRGLLDALADHEARENELLSHVLDDSVAAQD